LWPSDGLKHFFAGYHLVLFKAVAALALQLGHKSTFLILSNYRHRVRPEGRERYFNLLQGTLSEKQISLQAKGDLFLKRKTILPQARSSDRIGESGILARARSAEIVAAQENTHSIRSFFYQKNLCRFISANNKT